MSEPEPSEQSNQPEQGTAGPDLDELARKVAELLLRELQLENERNGKY